MHAHAFFIGTKKYILKLYISTITVERVKSKTKIKYSMHDASTIKITTFYYYQLFAVYLFFIWNWNWKLFTKLLFSKHHIMWSPTMLSVKSNYIKVQSPNVWRKPFFYNFSIFLLFYSSAGVKLNFFQQGGGNCFN